MTAAIEAIRGDITTQDVEVIVNAANSSLMGGGGVDGAIHRAGGPQILKECKRIRATSHPGGLPVGQAVATGGGDLPSRWVIHTVGPNWHAGQTDPELLKSCFGSSLDLCQSMGARSIAFPAISAGIYGWDPTTVAEIAITVTRAHPAVTDGGIDLVRFVLFGDPVYQAFAAALNIG